MDGKQRQLEPGDQPSGAMRKLRLSLRRVWRAHDDNLDYQHLKYAAIRSTAVTLVVVAPLTTMAAFGTNIVWFIVAVAVPVFVNRMVYHSLVAPLGTYKERLKNRVSTYGYVFFFVLLFLQKALNAPQRFGAALLILVTVTSAVNFVADLKEFAPLWEQPESIHRARLLLGPRVSEELPILQVAYQALEQPDREPKAVRAKRYRPKPIVKEGVFATLCVVAFVLAYYLLTAPFQEAAGGQNLVATALWLGFTMLALLLLYWQRRAAKRFNASLARANSDSTKENQDGLVSLLGDNRSTVFGFFVLIVSIVVFFWETFGIAWALNYVTPWSIETLFNCGAALSALTIAGLLAMIAGKERRASFMDSVRSIWAFARDRIRVRDDADDRTTDYLELSSQPRSTRELPPDASSDS